MYNENISDQECIEIYNNVTQEDYEELEAMYELFVMWHDISRKELERLLSYFVLKSYLDDNDLI